MQRSAMRELAFQLIYGIEIQKGTDKDTLEMFFENNEITEQEVKDYLKTRLRAILFLTYLFKSVTLIGSIFIFYFLLLILNKFTNLILFLLQHLLKFH